MSIGPHRADDWGGGAVEPAAWILGGDLSLFKTLLRVRQAEFEAQTGVHNPVLQSLVSQRWQLAAFFCSIIGNCNVFDAATT